MKNNSLTKNTIMLSIGTILTKCLSFIMVPLFSRWLSAEDYGSFDLLCTYVTLLVPFIGLATNQALFRLAQDAKTKEGVAKYTTNSLFVFTLNIILSFVCCTALKIVINYDIAYCFFFLLASETLLTYFRGFLRAIRRLDIYSFASAISTVFSAIFVTFLIKFLGLKLEGIIIGYAIGYTAGCIIIVFWSRYYEYFKPKSISLNVLKEMIGYSYPLIPNTIGWWVINVSDRLIIKLFLGPVSNGIYAIAYKIPNILSSIFDVFNVSWQQAAVESLDSKEKLSYYNSVLNKLIRILTSLCCLILSTNFVLFRFVFDTKYITSHLYSPILVAGVIFTSLSQFFGGLQISLKRPKENGVTTVIGAISNVVVHLIFVNFIGLYAAAISTLFSQIVVCTTRFCKLRDKISFKIEKPTVFCIFAFLYFNICAYFIMMTPLCVINLIFAFLIFVMINREKINSIIRSITKRIF